MKQLDELIRGEMSAVKTFDTVLSKVSDPRERDALSTMRSDHVNAVQTLKRFASAEIREDSQSTGAWGAFAETFTKGATLFGDKAAISALKKGEEHGLKDYREALDDNGIEDNVKQVIRSELLPRQERHLSTINNMIS